MKYLLILFTLLLFTACSDGTNKCKQLEYSGILIPKEGYASLDNVCSNNIKTPAGNYATEKGPLKSIHYLYLPFPDETTRNR